MDADGDERLNYEEFLAAVMLRSLHLSADGGLETVLGAVEHDSILSHVDRNRNSGELEFDEVMSLARSQGEKSSGEWLGSETGRLASPPHRVGRVVKSVVKSPPPSEVGLALGLGLGLGVLLLLR